MNEKKTEAELNELRNEIDSFKKEKERVRTIIGQVGGMPKGKTKLYNILFALLIIIPLVVSLMSHGVWQLAMIEIATAALSVKLLYLIHMQSKVNHFQLWILSSIEWRLNEINKKVDDIGKDS